MKLKELKKLKLEAIQKELEKEFRMFFEIKIIKNECRIIINKIDINTLVKTNSKNNIETLEDYFYHFYNGEYLTYNNNKNYYSYNIEKNKYLNVFIPIPFKEFKDVTKLFDRIYILEKLLK